MDGEPEPGTLVATPLDEVAAAIVELIDAEQPDVVVTLDGSDGHRDHLHIRDATLIASRRAEWRTPRVYLQCLSQVLMRRWVEALHSKQPESGHLVLSDLGTPDELITTVLDSSSVLELRERGDRTARVAAVSVRSDAAGVAARLPHRGAPSPHRARLGRRPVETDIFDFDESA